MNWLFLRGLTREQRHWGSFRDIFTKHYPHSFVHCIDLPGSGTEFSRSSPASMKGIAEDLRTRWLELRSKTEGDWSLLAISLGAMAGMEWVHAFPSDFRHFVMINSSAANLSHPLDRLCASALVPMLKAVSQRDPFLKEKAILAMTTNKSESEIHELAGVWANYAREYPLNAKVALAQISAALKFRAPDKLAIPTLVLASQKDRFTSPKCSEQLARRFAAPIIVNSSAGHDLPLEESEWVVNEVKTWIEGLKKPRSDAKIEQNI